MNKKHLFFDMDGTLTPSRSPMSAEMLAVLREISQTHDIIVVSGSHNDQMRSQIPDLPIIQLGQNGNHALHPEHKELWNDKFTEAEKAPVLAHTEELRPLLTWPVPDEADLLEDRGSQISFSIYGHHADPAIKRTIDPDFSLRRGLLQHVPFSHDLVEAKIAGTTCIDYMKKGRHKGYNVARLIEQLAWEQADCVYYGDALFPGGNDETVVGVIETVEVTNPEDTLHELKQLLTESV